MRAAILREYGATPEVGSFRDPQPGNESGVVVEVLAAGLNPVDLAIASGRFYGPKPPLPSVVGREGVGRLPDGSLAYFNASLAPFGSFAQRTLIDPAEAFAVPAELDPALAVCFGIAGLAAWLALATRAQLQAGEKVLVLGASGVVGQIAVQAARLLGAGLVVAAARSAAGLSHATELGADATVHLEGAGDLAAAFREAGGGGYDVVIDPLWGPPGAAAVESCNPGARVVQLGQAAGETATLKSATIRGTPLSILGHTNFAVPQDVRRRAYERMAVHALAGELTVEVERVPLDDVPAAWQRQAAGTGGVKLAIIP